MRPVSSKDVSMGGAKESTPKCWGTPVFLALGSLRWEDLQLKASLG